MKITLRFFASVREKLSCSTEIVTLPAEVRMVGQVREWLITRGGIWAEVLAYDRNIQMAYQFEICEFSTEIFEDSEVAFFPPVTGG
ncbi:MAG: moaD [Solimicrobium sp.]|jgi:molybdopterin synthase sulfur carrier subunit|nr:moaD [Solimicrobium sp.]